MLKNVLQIVLDIFLRRC